MTPVWRRDRTVAIGCLTAQAVWELDQAMGCKLLFAAGCMMPAASWCCRLMQCRRPGCGEDWRGAVSGERPTHHDRSCYLLHTEASSGYSHCELGVVENVAWRQATWWVVSRCDENVTVSW